MIFKKIIAVAVLALSIFSFSACEPKGTAEKAGEQIDQAIDKTSDKAGEAAESVKEKVGDVAKAVKKKTQ